LNELDDFGGGCGFEDIMFVKVGLTVGGF